MFGGSNYMLRGMFVAILVCGINASSLATTGPSGVASYMPHHQNVSMYSFASSNNDKCSLDETCMFGMNPVVSDYFSKYDRRELLSFETLSEVLSNREQLSDLKSTADRIYTGLKFPMWIMGRMIKEALRERSYYERAMKYMRGGFGYFRKSQEGGFERGFETDFKEFIEKNKDSVEVPALFFNKYGDFVVKLIMREIRGYGDKYGIPDELFGTLAAVNELDQALSICDTNDWDITTYDVLKVINKSILETHENLIEMIEEIEVAMDSRRNRQTIWEMKAKAHRNFIANQQVTLYRIVDRISDIKNGLSPQPTHGRIISDDVYDITLSSNKASKSEKIDVDHLKAAIRKINEVRLVDAENLRDSQITPEIERLWGDHLFKYTVGKKAYFLKFVEFGTNSLNTNDILFEKLNSPYIAKTYKVLYNRAVIKNRGIRNGFWTLSELLDVSGKYIDFRDGREVAQLTHDVLRGLEYLQSEGIGHNDLYLRNIQGKRVTVNGQTRKRFKIIDFGLSQQSREFSHEFTLEDMSTFLNQLSSYERLKGDEKALFNSFVDRYRSRNQGNLDFKEILRHPFLSLKDRKPKEGVAHSE